MIALVGAMFVALAPARAHSIGECSDPEYLTAEKCRMEVAVDHDDNDSTPDQVSADGSPPGNNDPWTPYPHSASNHPPTVTITFHDSDGIVSSSAGQLTGTVTVSGIHATEPQDADGDVDGFQPQADAIDVPDGTLSLAWVRVSGELDHATAMPLPLTNEGVAATADNSTVSADFTVVIPAGTTPGQYTVSATVISATTATNPLYDYNAEEVSAAGKSASKAFTVGEAGTGLASADLSLGNREPDDKTTVKDESRPESGSAVADGDGVNLLVTASNSLGNKSNNGDVTQVTVIAPGGMITITGEMTAAEGDGTAREMDDGTNSASLGGTEAAERVKVGQTISVNVKKADQKPGNVDVYVILTGNGAAISETLTLAFTGDASALALGEASGSLFYQLTDSDDDNRDKITFAMSATDSGGNNADVPAARIDITGPDGKRVGTNDIGREQGPNSAGVENAQITVTSKKEAPASLKAGEYKVKVTAGDDSAEQTFNVVGAADAIAVTTESSTDEIQLGSLITVTANVTSGDANVAEKTKVVFTAAGALKLTYVGEGAVAMANTKAGVATVQFVVSEGSGLASIIVTAPNASGTASISLAGEEAMAEEEASVACLSNLAGFSTWSCGVETSASEIFGFVSARGATALHLWNGSAWVRYSVVDGTMVPGSSDFMVAENDILYISN